MYDYDFSSAIGRLFAVTNYVLSRPNIRREWKMEFVIGVLVVVVLVFVIMHLTHRI